MCGRYSLHANPEVVALQFGLDEVLEFEPRYNATAAPFDWRFTRADLNDLVRRIQMHRSGPFEQAAA